MTTKLVSLKFTVSLVITFSILFGLFGYYIAARGRKTSNIPASARNQSEPKNGEFYLGKVDGKTALYLDGNMTIPGSSSIYFPFDFQKLDDRTYISKVRTYLGRFVYDESGENLIGNVSFGFGGTDDTYSTQIIKVNLNDLSLRFICSHKDIFDPNCGSVQNVYGSDYLVTMSLYPGDCYNCDDPGLPDNVSIMNMKTKKSRVLGQVGDLEVNLETMTVSYRFMKSFREKCEPSPGCRNDSTRIVYRPSGQKFTARLP